MADLSAYKQNVTGFRKFVQLLESTDHATIFKAFSEAAIEDLDFLNTALKYVITFDVIGTMDDRQLSVAFGKYDPELIAQAISHIEADERQPLIDRLPDDLRKRVGLALKGNCSEEDNIKAYERLVLHLRELERARKIDLQRIPEDIEEIWRED